jgi:thiamine biosynthesis lipoprotein
MAEPRPEPGPEPRASSRQERRRAARERARAAADETRAQGVRAWVPWVALIAVSGAVAFWLHDPASRRRPRAADVVDVDVVDGAAPTGGSAARPGGGAPDVAMTYAERRLMGTVWRVGVAGAPDPAHARAAMERGLDEVARLEALLSEWQPTSELSALNRGAGGPPQRIGPELLACLVASLEVARWSDGAFDVTWAVMRDLWDFGPQSRRVPPTEAQVRARLPLWNWRDLVVDPEARTARLRHPGMAVGLGGIAKGYALDALGDALRASGYPDFIVFGGGQILVGGRRGARPWRVGIQHPRDPERYFAFVEVEGPASVATSGDYEHAWEHEGVVYHHILDPETGFPSRRSASVTVISPTALWADAVDTAVFIMGPARGIAALATAPGGPHEAIVVDPDLRLSTTPGTERRLVMRAALDAQYRLGGWIDDADAPGTLPPLPPPEDRAAGAAR